MINENSPVEVLTNSITIFTCWFGSRDTGHGGRSLGYSISGFRWISTGSAHIKLSQHKQILKCQKNKGCDFSEWLTGEIITLKKHFIWKFIYESSLRC